MCGGGPSGFVLPMCDLECFGMGILVLDISAVDKSAFSSV